MKAAVLDISDVTFKITPGLSLMYRSYNVWEKSRKESTLPIQDSARVFQSFGCKSFSVAIIDLITDFFCGGGSAKHIKHLLQLIDWRQLIIALTSRYLVSVSRIKYQSKDPVKSKTNQSGKIKAQMWPMFRSN